MVLANIFSDPPNVSATKKAQFAPDTKEQRKQESAAKALQSARASLKAAAETWTPKKACNPLSLGEFIFPILLFEPTLHPFSVFSFDVFWIGVGE